MGTIKNETSDPKHKIKSLLDLSISRFVQVINCK